MSMTGRGYGQFCPVAMASEVLGTRWTVLIMREILCGSRRFNDIRRGLPRISPALLSKRLSELEAAGLIKRGVDQTGGSPVYDPTAAGEDLRPVIMSIGTWGHRWLESQLSLKNLDPSLLMWDMRRNLNPAPLPRTKVTVQFLYRDVTHGQAKWWLVVDGGSDGGSVDLCQVDPGYDVDLYVVTDLRTMTAIWMGIDTVQAALGAGRLELVGSNELRSTMQAWLGLSRFAGVAKQVGA